jgi:Family of unknown function (DUF5709)
MSENDSYGEYATEADQQLQPDDTLDDRGVEDVLDEGYSPPEKWSVLEKFGNTAREEREGESLDQRLAEEEPDPALGYGDDEADEAPAGERDDLDLDDTIDDQPPGEMFDGEVGDQRAGRLVSPDEGAHGDREKDQVAADVGIDGGAASAEEAAVHVVEEE